MKDKNMESCKDLSNKVKILLVKKGIQLVLNNGQILSVDSNEQIKQGECALVKMEKEKDCKELESNTWTFVHASDHQNINMQDPYFYIEMPYGDLRPRLVFEKECNNSNHTRLRAIT